MKTLAFTIAALLTGNVYAAGNTLFDDVAPLTGANTAITVGSPLEATNALLLPSAAWTQRTVVARSDLGALTDVKAGRFWDMIDTNRTGPDAGRYLFMPFEPSNSDNCGAGSNCASGAMRVDLTTGSATTIVPVGTQNFQRGDASRWTPWGGWLTGEENYTTGVTGTGRLFEVTNPVTATATNLTDGNGSLVQRNNSVVQVSHEGMAFDSAKNLYFIDEFNGGSFYKFVSNNPNATNGDDFFASGTNYALKVGAGNNSSASGAFTWEALTGGANADGRAQADAVLATGYNRPEDMEITTLAGGKEAIMFTATGTNDVWTVNLTDGIIGKFASQSTIDAATGLAVGSALTSPDNMAIDADGNLYIIEDQETPNADIWRATDTNKDGVADSLSRWVAMQVTGAEPTGLFFSLTDPNKAYVNIQHPGSNNDRLMEINANPVPVPAAVWLFGSAIAGLVGFNRRRNKA